MSIAQTAVDTAYTVFNKAIAIATEVAYAISVMKSVSQKTATDAAKKASTKSFFLLMR